MKCPQCGTENPINRLYCDQCGLELEHDITEIQASIDKEIRFDRAKSIARTIRWFFVVSFLIFIAGYYFRRAYKDLPENDIVAFATAPTVAVDDRVGVETPDFGVPLPKPEIPRQPNVRVAEAALTTQLVAEDYQRRAVVVKQKGIKRLVEGLLVGDVVLYFRVPGKGEPLPVHIAAVRQLRPVGENEWEVQAIGLPETVRAPIDDPQKIQIPVQIGKPGEKPTHQAVALSALEELKPLVAE